MLSQMSVLHRATLLPHKDILVAIEHLTISPPGTTNIVTLVHGEHSFLLRTLDRYLPHNRSECVCTQNE